MTVVKVDKVSGDAVLEGEGKGGAYQALNELALDPRWKFYLENAPKHLVREMVTTYLELSDAGKDAARRYPPGYYWNQSGSLVHLAIIQEVSEFQHYGYGTVFFLTTKPAVGFAIELEGLGWIGHEPPKGGWWLK